METDGISVARLRAGLEKLQAFTASARRSGLDFLADALGPLLEELERYVDAWAGEPVEARQEHGRPTHARRDHEAWCRAAREYREKNPVERGYSAK